MQKHTSSRSPQHGSNVGIFGGAGEALKKIEAALPPVPKINLCSTLRLPEGHIVNISEALVAFDTAEGHIVQFMGAFCPPSPGHTNKGGAKFHTLADGFMVCLDYQTMQQKHAEKGTTESFYWNPSKHSVGLSTALLPPKTSVEYRVLRVRHLDFRAEYRVQLLRFDTPDTGDVDKRTMEVEMEWDCAPPIKLGFAKSFPRQKDVMRMLSWAAGFALLENLDLDRQIGRLLPTNEHVDESADAFVPVNPLAAHAVEDGSDGHIETLAETLGLESTTTNGVGVETDGPDGEGDEADAYASVFIPVNPLAAHTAEDEEMALAGADEDERIPE